MKGSSGNAIVATDLGLRTLLCVIYKKKLGYYNRVKSPDFIGSILVKKAMQYHEDKGSTGYMNEIRRIYRDLEVDDSEKWNLTLKRWSKSQIVDDLTSKYTLIGVELPTKWWPKRSYVDGSEESQIIASVRAGNSELGNRDNYMAAFQGSDTNGRIQVCQLCHIKRLSEIHVIMACPKMDSTRINLQFQGTSFQHWILNMTQSYGLVKSYCKLLEQTEDYKSRNALATLLGALLTEYKLLWVSRQ